jgi:hypothetical protein
VFWAFCRWWFFGAVLGVVVGGCVGSTMMPIFGALAGAWYGGIVGAVVGLVEAPLVAPAALFPSSAVVDRIWPGLVGFGVTAALGYARSFAGWASEADWEVIASLVGIAALSGAVSSWFGVAVTRRVRIPLRVVVLSAPALGLICAVGGVLSCFSHYGASEPDIIAMSVLAGLACGGILGGVLIVFNQLIAEEPSAT